MRVPRGVTLRPVATIMGLAIHLDRQPRRQTGEVDHIMVLRKLLPKPETARPLPKLLPQ